MTRILLVEDSPTQAMPIKARLQDELYEVALAENGKIALEMMPTFEPDLILTDLQMPVMNGLELLVGSLAQHPPVPVILITAAGSDELAMEALDKGAAAYLPKSQLNEKLLGTIRQVLDVIRADRSYSRLIGSLDYNEFHFVLDNDPKLIGPLVDLMQRMAAGMGLCNEVVRVRLGMALEHALQNALFHGNLELSREEIESENDFELDGEESAIMQRCGQPPYCDRKLDVTLVLTPSEATFKIRDDGPGFDISKLPAPQDPNSLEKTGGRGLVLIRSFMDEVTFSETGNEITMILRR